MEYLVTVRDGSTKRIGSGYGCMTVVSARRGTAEIVLPGALLPGVPAFESENQEILQAIRAVAEPTGERGLWVMDRSGDRRRILVPLLRSGRRFLIRLRGDRYVMADEQPRSVFEIAASCRLPYRETVVRQEPGGEQIWPLHFGARPVRLPDRPTVPLHLVVVECPWKPPLMLLTTERPGRSRRALCRLVESYFARWRAEESIRFVKQSYQLEDIRLLRYDRLRALVTLVPAAAYFAAVYLGKHVKLRLLAQHVLCSAKHIYGVPEFRVYAIADGIKHLLFDSPTGFAPLARPPHRQFSLLPLGV